MADFFQQDTPPTEEPQKIKLGDREFSQDELNQMVGMAEKVKEIESHHGSLDKIVSEFGRRGDELGKTKAELEQIKKAKETPVTTVWTDEQKQAAKQQIKELFGDELITRSEAQQLTRNEIEGLRLLNEVTNYEEEIDGTDGRPRFKKEEILQYMADHPEFRNPLKAYKDKYEVELDKWKEQQILGARGTGLPTQTRVNMQKEPQATRVTKDNIGQLVSEALFGGQE